MFSSALLERKKMKGSKFLLVSSIFLIIFAGADILLNLIPIIVSTVLGGSLNEQLHHFFDEDLAIFISRKVDIALTVINNIRFWVIGYSIFPLTAGIIGIRKYKNPQNVKKCLVMGIVLIALNVIALIPRLIAIIAVGFVKPTVLITAFPALAAAIFYTVGACDTLKAIKNASNAPD
jgi:hypothetical protein